MPLRRTRYRTISHSSSTQRMETIPQRKWTTLQSFNPPQKPNKVYNNERADGPTNPMEPSLEWLQLQNRIPTRKRRTQARCLNKTKGGHASGRRRKAQSERKDSLTKREILRHQHPRNGNNKLQNRRQRRNQQ